MILLKNVPFCIKFWALVLIEKRNNSVSNKGTLKNLLIMTLSFGRHAPALKLRCKRNAVEGDARPFPKRRRSMDGVI